MCRQPSPKDAVSNWLSSALVRDGIYLPHILALNQGYYSLCCKVEEYQIHGGYRPNLVILNLVDDSTPSSRPI